ncbi:hypothetical protein RFI_33169, partial [Reticulomyxa filosa]
MWRWRYHQKETKEMKRHLLCEKRSFWTEIRHQVNEVLGIQPLKVAKEKLDFFFLCPFFVITFFFEQMKKGLFPPQCFKKLGKRGEKTAKNLFFAIVTKLFYNCKQNKVLFLFQLSQQLFLKGLATEKGTNPKQKNTTFANKKKHSKKKRESKWFVYFSFFLKKEWEKYVLIELSGNKPVTFKPNGLSEDGKIADEISKEENWKRLQQAAKDGLNNYDQIDDNDDFMDVWNELIQNKQAQYYTFKMRNIVVITKNNERKTTWCPKKSNEPHFYQELEKEDWEKHLQDLRLTVGISEDYNLSDEKRKIVIKTGENLKDMWKDLYSEDHNKWSLQLKVVDQKIESILEDEKIEMAGKQ